MAKLLFPFYVLILCLCQYVSKNKTMSFSGVCFNSNRNATVMGHVPFKFVEQTIGNNEPTECCFLVFSFFFSFSVFVPFFFFRKFSPLYVTILCLVEGRARSRCYILCSFCMSICTLAQIKPQINRSSIHYFVPRLFTSIMYDPPSDNSLVMRAASSTSTLKSAPPILYLLFELLLYDVGSLKLTKCFFTSGYM